MKIKILICMIVILFLSLSIVYAQESKEDEEKKKELEEMGFDSENIDTADVDIVGENELEITETGSEKEIDVSQLDEITIRLPKGGIIITTGEDHQNIFRFAEGENEIEIKDGKVIIKKATLEYGSRINGREISGEVESYDPEKDLLVSKPGKPVRVDGVWLSPSNDGGVVMEKGIIKGKDIALANENRDYLGRLVDGELEIYNQDMFILSPKDINENPTVFENDKGVRIGVSELTYVSKGQVPKEIAEQVSGNNLIQYNGDFIVSPSNLGFTDINIEMKDGSYENVITKEIIGLNKVNLVMEVESEGVTNKVVINFNNDAPLVQGNLKGLKSNIGHMFKGERDNPIPWMVFQGEEITGKMIGKVDYFSPFETFGNIENAEVKKLLIKTFNLDYFNIDNLISSASEYIGDDSELQSVIIEELAGQNKINPDNVGNLFSMTQNNPEAQKKIIESIEAGALTFESTFSNLEGTVKLRSLLESASSDEIKEMIISKAEGFIYAGVEENILNLISKDYAGYERIEAILRERTTTLIDENQFNSLSYDEKKAFIEKSNFFGEESLLLAIEATKGNAELQSLVLDKVQGKITHPLVLDMILKAAENDDIRSQILDSFDPLPIASGQWGPNEFRSSIQNYNVEVVQKMLQHHADSEKGRQVKYDMGWDAEDMARIYQNDDFLKQTEGMDNTERWSLGLSISRRLQQQGMELTDFNIAQTTEEVARLRDENADRVILGENHQYIGVMHLENAFQKEVMENFARRANVPESGIDTFNKGVQDKTSILDSIENSKGPTTVYFNNHGCLTNIWLESHTSDEGTGDLNHPKGISYAELGDKLIARARNGESLSDMTLMLDFCHSHDFAQNLYSYMQKNGKGVIKDLPVIATATNRGQFAFGYNDPKVSIEGSGINKFFLYGIYQEHEAGTPMTLENIYRAERHYFKHEDSAVLVPSESGIITIGSSDDSVQRFGEKPDTEEPSTQPTLIEVSQIERYMQEILT
jgi:hypothetical protein